MGQCLVVKEADETRRQTLENQQNLKPLKVQRMEAKYPEQLAKIKALIRFAMGEGMTHIVSHRCHINKLVRDHLRKDGYIVKRDEIYTNHYLIDWSGNLFV